MEDLISIRKNPKDITAKINSALKNILVYSKAISPYMLYGLINNRVGLYLPDYINSLTKISERLEKDLKVRLTTTELSLFQLAFQQIVIGKATLEEAKKKLEDLKNEFKNDIDKKGLEQMEKTIDQLVITEYDNIVTEVKKYFEIGKTDKDKRDQITKQQSSAIFTLASTNPTP